MVPSGASRVGSSVFGTGKRPVGAVSNWNYGPFADVVVADRLTEVSEDEADNVRARDQRDPPQPAASGAAARCAAARADRGRRPYRRGRRPARCRGGAARGAE